MFKDLDTLNNTINLTQMDKDTSDHLTLSDLYAFAGSDKKAIRFTHIYIDLKDIPETFYIYTEIGKVIMPRHLNSKLEMLLEEDYYVNLMNRGELGIQVYRYQYENRHGYSVRFVRTPAWYVDTDDLHGAYTNWVNGYFDADTLKVQDGLNKKHAKEIMNKLYGSSLYGKVAREAAHETKDPYETCEYTNDPCFEHDCDLCPYNPYQE